MNYYENRATIIRFCIVVLFLVMGVGFPAFNYQTMVNKVKETQQQLELCIANDYEIFVDNIEVDSLDTETIESAYLRYSIVYDDAAKKVVLSKSKSSNKTIFPMFLR